MVEFCKHSDEEQRRSPTEEVHLLFGGANTPSQIAPCTQSGKRAGCQYRGLQGEDTRNNLGNKSTAISLTFHIGTSVGEDKLLQVPLLNDFDFVVIKVIRLVDLRQNESEFKHQSEFTCNYQFPLSIGVADLLGWKLRRDG